MKLYFAIIAVLCFSSACVPAQSVLTLKAALGNGLENYETIKARNNYLKAAEKNLALSRREYVPNLTLSAQQDYGTVNGQNGPLYGFNGLGVASSGLPLPNQNQNARFGVFKLRTNRRKNKNRQERLSDRRGPSRTREIPTSNKSRRRLFEFIDGAIPRQVAEKKSGTGDDDKKYNRRPRQKRIACGSGHFHRQLGSLKR